MQLSVLSLFVVAIVTVNAQTCSIKSAVSSFPFFESASTGEAPEKLSNLDLVSCGNPTGSLTRFYTVDTGANTAGRLSVSLCGSTFDTYLSVFKGTACDDEGLVCVASNDDSPRCSADRRLSTDQSYVEFFVDADEIGTGELFIVAIHGSENDNGNFNINIEFDELEDRGEKCSLTFNNTSSIMILAEHSLNSPSCLIQTPRMKLLCTAMGILKIHSR